VPLNHPTLSPYFSASSILAILFSWVVLRDVLGSSSYDPSFFEFFIAPAKPVCGHSFGCPAFPPPSLRTLSPLWGRVWPDEFQLPGLAPRFHLPCPFSSLTCAWSWLIAKPLPLVMYIALSPSLFAVLAGTSIQPGKPSFRPFRPFFPGVISFSEERAEGC